MRNKKIKTRVQREPIKTANTNMIDHKLCHVPKNVLYSANKPNK